jgi:hypothetical protein
VRRTDLVTVRLRVLIGIFLIAGCGGGGPAAPTRMSDGASLNLTGAVMADRHRTKYGDSVAPDELIAEPSQVVPRAIAWLRTGSS